MRSSEDIKKLVEEQKSSGQSVPEFCASRGLSAKNFYVWRQRTSQRQEKFAPVLSGKRIELELSSGACIKVAKEDLKVVLEALR
ncbi:MAG: hypothetical protein K1X79_09575 [Oligoflexia bacterium]|nr:hypothetical protein [Oligoflexia bacterium]